MLNKNTLFLGFVLRYLSDAGGRQVGLVVEDSPKMVPIWSQRNITRMTNAAANKLECMNLSSQSNI
jgi:hypothetical protein